MTSEQIDIIRASFAQVFFRKDEAGQMFYKRLFDSAPETRPLFKSEIAAQSRKLMDTLGVAVSALRDMPTLTRTLEALGERHRDYGVTPDLYPKVGEALIWTLEKSLGAAFDARTKEAWAVLYDAVAGIMEPSTRRR